MSLLGRLTLAVALFTAAPAWAVAPIELEPKQQGYKGKSITVSTKGADISTDAFAGAILDGDHYPMSASYLGVDALEECRTLERRADGTVIVYQRTGGNFAVSSRHYVLALKTVQETDDLAVVEWWLVKHTVGEDGSFTGPYADVLNKNRDDAVYTPYNHGQWRYDKAAGTISYSVESDPGGKIPDWMVSDAAVMAFPKELLKVKWGVEA